MLARARVHAQLILSNARVHRQLIMSKHRQRREKVVDDDGFTTFTTKPLRHSPSSSSQEIIGMGYGYVYLTLTLF